MTDTEHREQHNHGSGTFVGGDVHGGLWQVFLPPYGKKSSGGSTPTEQPSEQDDEAADDYEDRLASLIGSAWVASTAGLAVVYAVMGWAWADDAPTPSTAARVSGGLIAFYVCVAAVAAFFARLAQVFELWSEQCSITAVRSRGRLVAWPPASMSGAMAALTAAVGAVAELLASLFGWSSFGREIAQRAHLAQLKAAANAKSARAAVKRHQP
jgi:hypothetical protein